LSPTLDEILIVTEPRSASQSLATTAFTHRARKEGVVPPASLILLALCRLPK
jgi:hypothetical protein